MKVTNWGEEYDVALIIEEYYYGNGLCIEMVCTGNDGNAFCGEDYGNLTVNLIGGNCAEDEAYVDTNNMPNAELFIKEYKLGKPTGELKQSGFCFYPKYKFDMEQVKRYLFED